MHHNLDTNGITYLTLLFDTKQVPDELISYMGILKSVLGYVDTAHFTYGELFHEINAQSVESAAGCRYSREKTRKMTVYGCLV